MQIMSDLGTLLSETLINRNLSNLKLKIKKNNYKKNQLLCTQYMGSAHEYGMYLEIMEFARSLLPDIIAL